MLLCVSVFILQAELMREVDTSNLHSVLVCVPEFVKSQLLEQWLSLHLLPLILLHFPQMLVRQNIVLAGHIFFFSQPNIPCIYSVCGCVVCVCVCNV